MKWPSPEMKRLVLIVLDSVGVGGAQDAHSFGGSGFTDKGSNTIGHIAEFRAEAEKPLQLPNLAKLGLGIACRESAGSIPIGFDSECPLEGGFAFASEVSLGKDTPSGHWEIAGVPVTFQWTYFPDQPDCFPNDILSEILSINHLEGSLGNCHASGTEIIKSIGLDHLESGKPIFYTSADSVLQIACHEGAFGLNRLYQLCESARKVLDDSSLNVGRVIARPFVGDSPDDFKRTGNRRDYTVPPPKPTVLEKHSEAGGQVIGIGKIGDIFAHRGLTDEIKANGHPALWKCTLDAIASAKNSTLIMTNFVDFDSLYGHRRDPSGYASALEEFDAMLPSLYRLLNPDDLLIITADHGNDPTWQGTDHTRENIPILLRGAGVKEGHFYGERETFADIGQTVAEFFGLHPLEYGTSIL